jgi:acyl-CoA hydrolase
MRGGGSGGSMNSVPWQERYADKLQPARRALRVVKRGDSVFIGSGAGVPQLLVEELAKMSRSSRTTR